MAAPLLEPLLQRLDEDERNKIRTWLKCPLHNQRDDVFLLFLEKCRIIPFAPDNPPLQATVGGTTKDRLLRSYLLDRIEDYLSWQQAQSEQKESPINLQLLRAYRGRGLTLHLGNRVRRQSKQFDRGEYYDVDDFRQRYELEEMHQELRLDRDRRLGEDFDRPDQWLLRTQLATALRRATHSLAAAPFKRKITDIPLLAEYLRLVERTPELLHYPTLAIYFHLCRAYLPQPPKDILPFPALIALLQQHLKGFEQSEQKDLFKLLLNRAIRQLNENPDRARLQQAFDLYRLGIDGELLIDNRRVSVFTFNNFMGIAFRLGEIGIARSFLIRYADYLPPDSAEEVIALNEARLAYASKDYRAALLQLQKADYRDFLHLMNARTLQMRIYYEIQEYEVLRDLIRATRALLTRRRLTYHGRVYRNNLKMVQKLLNLRWERPAVVEKFRREVEEIRPLTEREWILRQIGKA